MRFIYFLWIRMQSRSVI